MGRFYLQVSLNSLHNQLCLIMMMMAEIMGLTEEQVEELKLKDDWGDSCIPSGGFSFNKDPMGRRNGKQPKEQMQNVLRNAVKEAKDLISKNLVIQGACVVTQRNFLSCSIRVAHRRSSSAVQLRLLIFPLMMC